MFEWISVDIHTLDDTSELNDSGVGVPDINII